MDKGELVCFSLENNPIRLKSMNAQRHPQLRTRIGIAPPEGHSTPACIASASHTAKTDAAYHPGTLIRSCFASGRRSDRE